MSHFSDGILFLSQDWYEDGIETLTLYYMTYARADEETAFEMAAETMRALVKLLARQLPAPSGQEG